MTFSALDWTIGTLYFVLVPAIGIYAGRREGDLGDYFLGGRRIPWWAVWLSIIAAETSAVTFIAVPAFAYARDWTYLATAFGNILGRIVVAFLFLKPYFELGVFTVYGYLEKRFGPRSRDGAAVLFLLTRLLASGVRLYAGALIVETVTGLDVRFCIALLAGVTVIYTMIGGIKAVIATDVLQVFVMFGGAAAAAAAILHELPGGLEGVAAALPPGKTRLFDLAFDPSRETTLWGGLLVTFLIMASHGTDQDLVQRMLTAKDLRSSRRALIASGLLDIPIVVVFLSIGTLLFVYYARYPDPTLPVRPDKVFPHFIVHKLPRGIAGLVVAGILSVAMGSLSAAMNAIASTVVIDLWKPYVSPHSTPEDDVRTARGITLVAAHLLVAVAIGTWWVATQGQELLLNLAFQVVGYTWGALLGVFLLGFLSARSGDRWNLVAMGSGIASVVLSKVWLELAWSWFIPLGAAVTMAVGLLGPAKATAGSSASRSD